MCTGAGRDRGSILGPLLPHADWYRRPPRRRGAHAGALTPLLACTGPYPRVPEWFSHATYEAGATGWLSSVAYFLYWFTFEVCACTRPRARSRVFAVSPRGSWLSRPDGTQPHPASIHVQAVVEGLGILFLFPDVSMRAISRTLRLTLALATLTAGGMVRAGAAAAPRAMRSWRCLVFGPTDALVQLSRKWCPDGRCACRNGRCQHA